MRRQLISHFYGKFIEIIGLKARGNYSGPFLGLITFRFAYGRVHAPSFPHFYDFGIFGRALEPQNQLFLSLETPGHLKRPRAIHGTLLKFNIL